MHLLPYLQQQVGPHSQIASDKIMKHNLIDDILKIVIPEEGVTSKKKDLGDFIPLVIHSPVENRPKSAKPKK